MGLLAQLRESATQVRPGSLITENKEVAATLYRKQLIEQGGRLFDETYNRYTGLGTLLESADPREQFKAALTLNMLAKVENHIERMKEGVVQANLGALTPRVLDVVRIFYPNQVLTQLGAASKKRPFSSL